MLNFMESSGRVEVCVEDHVLGRSSLLEELSLPSLKLDEVLFAASSIAQESFLGLSSKYYFGGAKTLIMANGPVTRDEIMPVVK